MSAPATNVPTDSATGVADGTEPAGVAWRVGLAIVGTGSALAAPGADGALPQAAATRAAPMVIEASRRVREAVMFGDAPSLRSRRASLRLCCRCIERTQPGPTERSAPPVATSQL